MRKKITIKSVLIIVLIMLFTSVFSAHTYAVSNGEAEKIYNNQIKPAYNSGFKNINDKELLNEWLAIVKQLISYVTPTTDPEGLIEEGYNSVKYSIEDRINELSKDEKHEYTDDEVEELKGYDRSGIEAWLLDYSNVPENLPDEVKEEWRKKLIEIYGEPGFSPRGDALRARLEGATAEEVAGIMNKDTNTNMSPQTGQKQPDELATYEPDQKTSPDDVINEGSDFISTGKDNQEKVTLDGEKLEAGSDMLFNIFFAVGIVIAVGIGSYLGIKFMLGGVEDKASIKESLIPYFAGVIIMFASFSIWKLVLVLMQTIDNI